MEKRFNVIKESKFVKGGFCISCKKRDRTIELGLGGGSSNQNTIATTSAQKDSIEAMDNANK